MGGRGQLTPLEGRVRYRRPMGAFGSTIRRLGSAGVLGLVGVALSLVLFLTPITPGDSGYSDPCGSILVPASDWYFLGGELVHGNTPPCRDARMERLPWAAVIGAAGMAGVGFAFRPRRHLDD